MAKPLKVISGGARTALSIGKLIRFSLIAIFFIFILVNEVIIFIESDYDISAVLNDLGPRFLNPFLKISESYQNLINIDQSEDSNFFNSLLGYWDIYSNVYVVFMWVIVLRKVIFNPLLGQTNTPTTIYSFSIGGYLIVQILYLYGTGQSLQILIFGMRDFFLVLMFVVKKVVSIAPV